MPLVNAAVAVGFVTIGLFWAVLKLTKWSLNADEASVRTQHVNLVAQMYKTALLVIVVLTFGSGVGQWLYDVWHYLHTLL